MQEVAPNLHYMGDVGLVEAQGFRVAFCGGSGAEQASGALQPLDAVEPLLDHPGLALGTPPPPQPDETASLQEARAHAAALAQYAEQAAHDAERLKQRLPVDFLLTNAWPQHITRLSSVPTSNDAATWGVGAVARLAEAVRPRYHFAAAPTSTEVQTRMLPADEVARTCGVFWEREPYENPPFAALPAPRVPPITRFLSLARVANERKARWFMALQVVPATSQEEAPPALRPPNLTPSPFLYTPPPPPPPSSSRRDTIRYDAAPMPPTKRRRQGREREVMPVSPDQCWFCLSNPRLEKHLIVALGEECYMTLPKGQVPLSSDSSALVPGGGHVLLVPIAHIPSTYASEAYSVALHEEMRAFRRALAACYASYDAVPVSWEVVRRSHTRVGHTQTQVVPIPRDQLAGAEAAFREAADAEGLAFETEEVAQAFEDVHTSLVTAKDREDYCLIRLGDRPLLLLLRGERFNLQFPRETLTTYLGIPERAEWKACVRPAAIETAERDAFRDAFDEFGQELST